MTATLTDGTRALPVLVTDGTRLEQHGGAIAHPLLSGGVDVTVRPLAPRQGSLTLRVESLAAAQAVASLHEAPILTLTDGDGLILTYAVTTAGGVSYAPDGQRFVVNITGVQEVTP